jgi:hypothetical protein
MGQVHSTAVKPPPHGDDPPAGQVREGGHVVIAVAFAQLLERRALPHPVSLHLQRDLMLRRRVRLALPGVSLVTWTMPAVIN